MALKNGSYQNSSISTNVYINDDLKYRSVGESNVDSKNGQKSYKEDVYQGDSLSTYQISYDDFKQEESSKMQEEKEPFESISAPLSQCYKMAETDPLVEELLEQLPRSTDDYRKHWEMILHCERAAFPRTESNLPLPSREVRISPGGKPGEFKSRELN
ncbi:hypothetical protein HZU73_08931 [Apis mellifera caucasica]|uniref:Uncharacterized protein LOC102656885 n=1 Tax=Apis mellifera TaxID=7460 RepID=A0A7M7MRQ6_APIME|nr:uncharacterized protein LOC102656885 [Apis mellifera]XP_026300073.1 uncharacterized protein LOC102656885 [Apis mellifera]XP_026300074.1 uncharacterized protein LOC102656885 [Apis mellifera]KAG6795810.1 hypothetical protein HZU73_08931 [Apis mellifera caucasica]KAG9429953.1 hypothetical protein HZU67_08234 [Apis mellifera carnica]|eukprot:XP_026300072.1 uncharacterized protein LOC102656885 [Apis mellifera]